MHGYQFIATIGEGSGGVVKLATDQHGQHYAIKKFNKYLL